MHSSNQFNNLDSDGTQLHAPLPLSAAHELLLVSQFLKKIHNYLMEWFRIDLKTFLGLAIPKQYSQTVRK